ncbi:type II toxin-antitoxin system mRNA interferase toxin, RelE/StbE family [Massilia sp. CCM 8695]|uniref:Type II toxin-antitoxin system mRNA interferase toxin, RelE/StbE family n=1 Tax=Massilia frigida TaxID=2609281 RepID=A0ABX0NK40_9BURK|nr:type II toxin-antitoxin system RelE/ParE family toxin [Massilia frigida]NHZ83395.1 type II toxin-antitoxin system mRNA interferase toxin, RelE/StbE family [Massilia frigida]
MHVIHWKKQAINDLIKIAQHIARDSPASAEKMIDLIEGKVMPLAAHPNLGRAGRKRGTHELVAHESYIVIYRVLAKKVEILRVKHTAQQWPPASA